MPRGARFSFPRSVPLDIFQSVRTVHGFATACSEIWDAARNRRRSESVALLNPRVSIVRPPLACNL